MPNNSQNTHLVGTGPALENLANLIEFLNKIFFSENFLSRHRRSQKDSVRERLLPFHNMIFFLMNMIKGSLQDELDYFFKAVHAEEVTTRTVTKSAFTKARKKLRHQVFIELGSYWKEVGKFFNSGKKEGVITLPQSLASIEQCHFLNLPVSPIKVRAIRVELLMNVGFPGIIQADLSRVPVMLETS